MTDELMALADRVEALTGPCRETAHFVLYAAGWRVDAATSCVIRPDGSIHTGVIPDPTASLDAAMTLARNDEEAFIILGDAMICMEKAGWPRGEWVKTLPRYVTAAALRARAAKEPEA